jgi:nicotinate-nucleotide--dimethylbenzimidazole phosphoribosyltransferase
MGIGNTTASSAIVALLHNPESSPVVSEVTGRGTGIDDTGLTNKIAVIERALALHNPDPADPIGVLAAIGGFEIAGLAGVIIGAAAKRTPVVIDGFISGAAALVAARIAPAVLPYLIAEHQSVERGHRVTLNALHLEPLLHLDMRLGEGTGAVLAISLCLAACKIQHEMATFAEAGVAGGIV